MSKKDTYPVSARGPVEHEVREQIIAAATEHFSRYGYEKTTVSELAEAVGFSKAYIYKFFASKQVIAEMICANCMREIEAEVRTAIEETDQPLEKLRRMFRSIVTASLRLVFQDRKLYEIAAAAATGHWDVTLAYENRLKAILQEIILEGRRNGDFERKTPIDETVSSIYLVMHPYINPVLLQYSFDHAEAASVELSNLILRSLSP